MRLLMAGTSDDDTRATAGQEQRSLRICLGVSGSVAAVKAPELAAAFLKEGVNVDLVVTESAYKLLQATYRGEQPWAQLIQLAGSPCSGATLQLLRDSDEWDGYGNVGTDTVLHVELAKRNQAGSPVCLRSTCLCAGRTKKQG